VFGKHKTEVLVVGAGPVGLFTALRLKEQGIDVSIVDKLQRTGTHSYALALHPASLELLDETGLADEIVSQGYRVDKISFSEGKERRADVKLADLGTKFPFVLVLPQRILESTLEDRLQQKKVKVLWNHRVQDLQADPLGVSAEVARLDRVACGYPIARMEWMVVKTYQSKSPLVVGADGYHSFVRQNLGIEFNRMADQVAFSVFEFDCPTDLQNEARVILDDGATCVLWPMPENRCRWSFQTEHPGRHEPTLEYLNLLIKSHAPWFPVADGEIHWSSVVRFDRRLVDRFGQDRIWLAGDSAHLTSPVGVQSMNAGLSEAHDLTQRLTRILRQDGPLDSLDAYNEQHRKAWRALMNLDDNLRPTADAPEWIRSRAARILSSIPATGENLAALLAQVGLSWPNQ